MRSHLKIILVVALLSCAALGLRQAHGQRGVKSNQGNVSATAATSGSRPLEDSTVHVDDGSFVVRNLTLTKMMGSTVLNGNVVNKTKHRREEISFEVRAYDRDGQILKGLESRTIFASQELKAGASAAINYGYGVWLQGIPADRIARIEILETGEENMRSTLARLVPFASHALDGQRYSEIEE